MYDELIKALRELQALTERCDDEQSCFECKNRELCDKHDNTTLSKTYKQAADAIEELVATVGVAYNELANNEANKPRWISVTERLPEKYSNCIVFSDGYVKEAHFCLENFYDPIEDYMRYKVTHWMPLPEPPKED